jgi:hypothetical protein
MNNVIKEPSNVIKIIKFMGRVSGLLGIVTILSYISGFIIINSYLSKYGLIAGELFGAKYLSAGLLFLVMASIFIVIWWDIKKYYTAKEEYKTPQEKFKHRIDPLAILIFTIVFLSVIFSPSKHTVNFLDRFFQKNWSQYLFLVPFAIFIILVVLELFLKPSKPGLEITELLFLLLALLINILKILSIFFFFWLILLYVLFSLIFRRTGEIEPFAPITINSSGQYLINPVGFAFTFMLAYLTIWIFGRTIYERITPNVGGGSPVKVKVLLREALPRSFSTITKDTSDASVIGEAYLLHQEQTSLILLIPDSIGGDKVIRLNDNEVRLMIPISETNVRPKSAKNPNQSGEKTKSKEGK